MSEDVKYFTENSNTLIRKGSSVHPCQRLVVCESFFINRQFSMIISLVNYCTAVHNERNSAFLNSWSANINNLHQICRKTLPLAAVKFKIRSLKLCCLKTLKLNIL